VSKLYNLARIKIKKSLNPISDDFPKIVFRFLKTYVLGLMLYLPLYPATGDTAA
jgi:hypothetical protein